MNNKKFKKIKETVEHFVDKIIPILVILLGIVLVMEFTMEVSEEFEHNVKYLDYFVVAFFLIDLCFKWRKVRKVKKFVRLYWLDILAVFPFYLIFRVYLFFTELAKTTEQAQKILHEAVLLREIKIIEPALKETEIAVKEAGRLNKLGRAVRTLQRFIRFLKGRWFVARAELLKAHKEIKQKKKNK